MKRLSKNFVYNFILSIISLLSVSFFWNNSLLLFGILIVVSILTFLISVSKEDLVLFIVCGFWFTFSESIAIYFGVWTYTSPHIFGVPYWLPLLWGIAAVFIKRVSLEIHDFIKD